MSYLTQIEAVQSLLHENDHFDVKTIEGDVSLREFIAGSLTYSPTWIKALYAIRWGFVRLLGMTQEIVPTPRLTPESVPFEKGEWATFFQVHQAEENKYWIATASDKHLDAYLIDCSRKSCKRSNTLSFRHNRPLQQLGRPCLFQCDSTISPSCRW